MNRRGFACLSVVLTLALASCCQCPPRGSLWCSQAAVASRPEEPATLRWFRARMAAAPQELPTIIKAAEAAADRIIAHPAALINVPYGSQKTFAEEILNRSGGLASAFPSVERPGEVTEHDVFLFSVRSWETNGEEAVKHIVDARAKGWLVVLFASSAGMPEGLTVDYLIDNGATSGSDDEAATNALANCMNSWSWCCEYVGALTRCGKCPGILKSALLEGADEHNSQLQSLAGRHRMGACESPVPAGSLADAYLRRVEGLVNTLAGERIQGQIDRAASIIARRLALGDQVAVSTCTHILLFEIFLDNRSPWKPFHTVWRAKTAFPANVRKGDLLVWFGYKGMSTPYEDYGKYIRETGADLVTCFVADSNPANNAPESLAHIDQSWAEGDAEVDVPCPPGHMAPVSGISQVLLYRMLDAAVVQKLHEMGVTDLKPVPAAAP